MQRKRKTFASLVSPLGRISRPRQKVRERFSITINMALSGKNMKLNMTKLARLIAWVLLVSGRNTLFGYYADQTWFYDVNYDNTTATLVQGYSYSSYTGSVTIPATVGGGRYIVTALGHDLFDNCTAITDVTLHSSIKEIGIGTFGYCSKLTYIYIPNGLEKIGSHAFSNCNSLKSINLPSSLRSIGNSAFNSCTSLTEIELPANIISIGSGVFSGCTSLTNITISENNPYYKVVDGILLTKDGKEMISSTGGRSSLDIPLTVTNIVDRLCYNNKNLTNLVIPGNVKTVGEWSFAFCGNIENLILDEGIECLSDSAFHFCNKVKRIKMPASVKTIGEKVFSGWGARCYFVEDGNSYYKVSNDAIVTKDGTELIAIPGGSQYINIPYGIESIPSELFTYVHTQEVQIPESVRRIEEKAFYSAKITSIDVPDSVTFIGKSAFSFCTDMERVVIGSGVDTLGKDSFYYMSKLTNVVFKGRPPDGLANASIKAAVTINYPMKYHTQWTNVLAAAKLTNYASYGSIDEILPPKQTTTYSVTFDSNGGVGSIDRQTYQHGTIYNLPVNSMHKDGCSFAGWSTNATSMIHFYDGEAIKDMTAMPSGEVVMRAVWNVNNYTLLYDGNGGSGSMSSQSGNAGECVALSLNKFTRIGYSFAGWALSANGAVVYNDGDVAMLSSGLDSANIVLYAIWTPNQYFIRYNANGGSGEIDIQMMQYDSEEHLSKNAFQKQGYDFAGWSYSPDGEVVFSDEDLICNLSADVGHVVDLYAVWSIGSIMWPIIDPPDGYVFLTPTCTVTISCGLDDSEIYYSTNGTTPRLTDAFLYNGPFVISETTTIKAITTRDGVKSPYVTATITQMRTTLGDAVGSTGITFNTGGDAEWLPVFDATASGAGISARSGAMQSPKRGTVSSWMSTEVVGAGTLSFNWRVDCEKDDSGDCTWDRLMVFTNGVEVARIDGTTSWESMQFAFDDSGTNEVRWIYLKDNYDEEGAICDDCGWVDDVVWLSKASEELIPSLGDGASEEVVKSVVGSINFADEGVLAAIGGSVSEYKAFKAWASCVADGEAAVIASTNAAVSYLLGAERLFVNAPKIEFGECKVSAATGEVAVSITVRDGEDAVAVASEKVKEMFEATNDLGDWNSTDKKLTPIVTDLTQGRSNDLHFKVRPGDGTSPRAFLRIRK